MRTIVFGVRVGSVKLAGSRCGGARFAAACAGGVAAVAINAISAGTFGEVVAGLAVGRLWHAIPRAVAIRRVAALSVCSAHSSAGSAWKVASVRAARRRSRINARTRAIAKVGRMHCVVLAPLGLTQGCVVPDLACSVAVANAVEAAGRFKALHAIVERIEP